MSSTKVRINIPGFGTLSGSYRHDWETGVTTYTVTGPRVRGTFQLEHDPRRQVDDPGPGVRGRDVTAFTELDVDNPRIRVQYGAGDAWREEDREDRPVVNGVHMLGATVVNVDTMRQRRLNRWDVVARRSLGHGACRAPEATAERVAVVVYALAVHWLGRPENYALRLAAVRRAAERAGGEVAREVAAAEERVAVAEHQLARARLFAEQVAVAAAMPVVRSNP